MTFNYQQQRNESRGIITNQDITSQQADWLNWGNERHSVLAQMSLFKLYQVQSI